MGWPYKIYFSVKFSTYFSLGLTKFVCCLDGVSIIFLILTTFLVPIAFSIGIYSNYLYHYEKFIVLHANLAERSPSEKSHTHDGAFINIYDTDSHFFPLKAFALYSSLYLLLEVLILLIFLTVDYLFFYILFETIMIPLYLIMGITGSRINRVKASYYLLFFTLIVSIFFLMGVMYISRFFYSTNIFVIQYIELSPYLRKVLWIFFFFAAGSQNPSHTVAHMITRSTCGSIDRWINLVSRNFIEIGFFWYH